MQLSKLECSHSSVTYATYTVFRVVRWTRAHCDPGKRPNSVNGCKVSRCLLWPNLACPVERCQPINAVRANLDLHSARISATLSLAFIYIRQMLAEASQHDKVWGIGMDAFDANVERQECWRGQNLLGKILMYVRTKIRWERPDLANRPQVREAAAAMEAQYNPSASNAPLVSAAGPAMTADSLGAYDMTALQNQLRNPGMAFLRAPVTAPTPFGEPGPEVVVAMATAQPIPELVITTATAQPNKAEAEAKTPGKN